MSLESNRVKVFISHCWGENESGQDNHKLAADFNKALQAEEILTWFDDIDMGNDVLVGMSAGIDWADIVIILVTKRYIDKCAQDSGDSCRAEFSYAASRKGVKKIVLCIIDKTCLDQGTWHGPFGLLCCNQLYIDCTEGLANMRLAPALRKRMSI